MNMSNFNKLVDRMQQGFVNFPYLQRALVHPDGFADQAAFQMDHNGATPDPPGSAIDTSARCCHPWLLHYGISQGGIMGGADRALARCRQGRARSPGINYSTCSAARLTRTSTSRSRLQALNYLTCRPASCCSR